VRLTGSGGPTPAVLPVFKSILLLRCMNLRLAQSGLGVHAIEMSANRRILLQKSKVAGLKIFRENIKQRAIADSYDLNRVTEVACEFCLKP
jgi:hypothetical protein